MRRRRPALPPLLLLALLASACSALDERDVPSRTRAPEVACEADCYIVNASVSGTGQRVFVGGYVDDQRGVVRQYEDGAWGTLLDSAKLGAVSRVFASEDALYVVSRDGVRELDLHGGNARMLEVSGTAVWSSSLNDIVVLEDGADHRWDGEQWRTQPFAWGFAASLSGRASDDLYAVNGNGTVVHSDGSQFASLDAQPPFPPNDLWDAGGFVMAVDGDDHGDGELGPGEIMRYDGERWDVLQEAPDDALLGVAVSDSGEVYAVGATSDDHVQAVVWRFAGEQWTRHVLPRVQAFLWDVWCGDEGNCFAVGTDNTFIDLRDLDRTGS